MKDSHKKFSRSRTPATSEGVDENRKSYQEMGLNLRSPNKPATKNFMSPTFSAASKANPPRKKVLAERNQIADSPLQKTPTIDSKSTQKTPDFDSRVASVVSSPGSTEIGNNDSDLRPYDPLTNYLSPRPQFLRYKPNRLQEIFLRMEKEDVGSSDASSLGRSVSPEAKEVSDDETNSLHASEEGSQKKENKEDVGSRDVSSLGRSVSPEAKEVSDNETDSLHASEEGSLKKENEKIDFSDEEFEEEEENEEIEFSDEEFEEKQEMKGGRASFLKFLLLLVVLVFSTSYICSMNSPTRATQDRYRMHNLSYYMVTSFEGKTGVFNSQRNLTGLNHTVIGYGTLAEELVTDVIRGLDDEWCEVKKVQAGIFEVMEVVKDELTEEEARVVYEDAYVMEVAKDELIEEEARVVYEDDAYDLKMNTLEISNVKNENVEVGGGVVEVYDNQIERSDSSIGPLIVVKDENIEVLAALVEEQAGEIPYKKNIENVEQKSGIVEENVGLVEVYDYQVEVPDFSNVTERSLWLMDPVKEVELEELNQEANEVESIEILNHEVDESLEEEEAVKGMETESISQGVIFVALFSVVSASLALSFCFKKARKVGQSSPPVFVPSIEPVVAEKCCLVVPDKEQKQIDSVDSYASHLHSVVDFKKEQVSENSYQTRAPSIELLSEFEVGSISNSIRSCGTKSRKIDSEVRSHYFYQEKELDSTGDSAQLKDFSAMNSASNGSYTAEKKMLKKQKLKGGDDEHKNILFTTPVRRSTRIRNRAITSP